MYTVTIQHTATGEVLIEDAVISLEMARTIAQIRLCNWPNREAVIRRGDRIIETIRCA